jgi:hypothetical protein
MYRLLQQVAFHYAAINDVAFIYLAQVDAYAGRRKETGAAHGGQNPTPVDIDTDAQPLQPDALTAPHRHARGLLAFQKANTPAGARRVQSGH